MFAFTSNIQCEHNRVKTSYLIDPAGNRFLREWPLGLSNVKNFFDWYLISTKKKHVLGNLTEKVEGGTIPTNCICIILALGRLYLLE